MHLVFYHTSDVFKAEEIFQANSIIVEIVPIPVQDKAYCGVCAKISNHDLSRAKELLKHTEYREVQ